VPQAAVLGRGAGLGCEVRCRRSLAAARPPAARPARTPPPRPRAPPAPAFRPSVSPDDSLAPHQPRSRTDGRAAPAPGGVGPMERPPPGVPLPPRPASTPTPRPKPRLDSTLLSCRGSMGGGRGRGRGASGAARGRRGARRRRARDARPTAARSGDRGRPEGGVWREGREGRVRRAPMLATLCLAGGEAPDAALDPARAALHRAAAGGPPRRLAAGGP